MLCRLLYLLSVVTLLVSAKNEDYKNHRIYNVKLKTEEQQNRSEELKSDALDYLKKPTLKYGEGKVVVPPSHFDWFEDKLQELGLDVEVAVPDVYEYLQNVQNNLKRTSRNEERNFDFTAYYRYDEILAHLRELETQYTNTDIAVNLVEVGRTDEDRPIVYLKISKASSNEEQKPIVVIEAGINPREWITVPAALYVANKVLENEDQLLDKADWIVVPVLNPDGYEYTHTNLRLWAKNRSLRSNLGFICPGANINRNFDMSWQLFDSSSSPCSHIYAGVEPFSEPEAQALRTLIEEFGSQTKLFVSIQNNGGFVTYPWSFERAATGMFRQQHLLGLEIVEAMDGDYKIDVGWQALGDRISGMSTDFVHDSGVTYAYNIDVEQRGDDGVSVPEDEILYHADNVWTAVKVAVNGVL